MTKKPATGIKKAAAAPVVSALPARIRAATDGEIQEIDLDSLRPDPWHPRGKVTSDSVRDLAQSIREVGLLQPPIVVERLGHDVLHKTGIYYEVKAGQRRIEACRSIGLRSIRVLVLRGDGVLHSDHISIVENEHRLALDPIRSAAAVARLLEFNGATIDGVAATLGFPRHWVVLRAQLARLHPLAR